MPLGLASGASPDEDEDVCFLTGQWQLFQKQCGHRWSLDDLLTAHFAAGQARSPARCLDLGCGIGSVLLMIAWRFPGARCVGIEAQSVSAALARKSIAWNAAGERVELVEGDFRELTVPGKFELVTGTPPYFPIGAGTQATRVQAAPCRFEHRGGVEAYCAAAARALTADGTFVFCQSAGQLSRVRAALEASRLHLRQWFDAIPREGKNPLISLFAAQRAPCLAEQSAPLVIRDSLGEWTSEFLAIREAMGMPPRPRVG